HAVDPALWAYGSGVAAANDVAAMPSLHMAAAYMAALGLRRAGRVAGTLGALYAACMAFTLAYLGEHYLVDEAAGVALAVLSWGAAGALLRRRSSPVPLASRSPRAPTLA
ncbi:MAG TPA: phosphatase PAP2 family protein, partial [Longimicrobiaceae bacterium]